MFIDLTPPREVEQLIQLYGEILKVKYNSGITDVVKTVRSLFSDVYNGIEYSEGFNEDVSKSAGNIYRRFLTLLGQVDPKPRELACLSQVDDLQTPSYRHDEAP